MEPVYRLNWHKLVKQAVKRRKSRKLTQAQLAVLAEVSKPTLNAFEQGRQNITVQKLSSILKVLGLD